MPECNIDAKGKAARFVGGVTSVLAGLVVAGLLATQTVTLGIGWLTVAGLTLGGAFAIYEARAGWCIVRAMGIRTPL
ncbi:MAG: hypothetical protein CMA10_07475 [Euryarchaeota archaeon]|nr:hypothetical protein [Euryarchaeota archaeon]|tara:strand:+ start:3025 stop:3255 length:231 start_codon:yes stop_codon:yes gene_type:complete